MYRYFAYMYVYAPLECLAPIEPREGVLSTLELELQTDVNIIWVLGIKPRSSGRATCTLNH